MSSIQVIANKMAEERLRRGFTLRELGSLCKVSYSTISKIENKKQHPRPKVARVICEALEIEFDQLFKIVDKEGA